MAILGFIFEAKFAPSIATRGHGYFAGEPPVTADPDDPDGRTKKLNVPSRVRVSIFERRSMQCVQQVVSDSDGTWEVAFLDPNLYYFIVGFDDQGLVNGAIQDWVQPALMP